MSPHSQPYPTAAVLTKLSRRINLRAFASERWATMTERVGEDRFNDRQRRKIGVTLREEVRPTIKLVLPAIQTKLRYRRNRTSRRELCLRTILSQTAARAK